MDAVTLACHLVEQLCDWAIIGSGISSCEEHAFCSITSDFWNWCIGS